MRPLIVTTRTLALTVCATIAMPSLAAITPTGDDAQASREVTQSIRIGHYETVNFDQAWSKKAYDRLLDMLDPQHLYLLQSDIDEFSGLRTSFGDDVTKGNLTRSYAFYNRFQERLEHRLEWLIDTLKKTEHFDFSSDQTLSLDKEVANWQQDNKALDAVWQKRLTNAALVQQITEPKTSEQKIRDRLVKRYEEQLKRIRQTKSEDVLSLIMGAETSSIDPHTEYMSPDESESFDIMMRLSLEGIGATLQAQDEYVKVAQLVPGGPADRSGKLHTADKIIAVGQGENGEMKSVVGMRLDDVVKMIRGKKGSVVRLQYIPARAVDATQTRTVTITRDKVKLEDQAAKSKVVEVKRDGHTQRIGVITVPAFYLDFAAYQSGEKNYRSSTRDVADLIDKLKKQHIDGLILDLRGNGGGALQEANAMVGLFVDRGPTVQVRDAEGRINLFGDTSPGQAWYGPMAVMVNRLSASASEIFAGAIQDYGRGLVLGTRTFGKGTVQTLTDLSHGEMRMTRAKFYRISGESTQERGVAPDIGYPSVYDEKDIGESALPNALPWDTVRPVEYFSYGDPAKSVPALLEQHNKRIKEEPNFRFLTQEAKLLAKLREENTTVSLNLDKRRAERKVQDEEQLKLENERRKALDMEPLKSWADSEDDEDSSLSSEKDSPLSQAETQESAEILADYANLLNKEADSAREAGDSQ
ncbi:Tail-specific protease [Carnimonas sp. R-84981]